MSYVLWAIGGTLISMFGCLLVLRGVVYLLDQEWRQPAPPDPEMWRREMDRWESRSGR